MQQNLKKYLFALLITFSIILPASSQQMLDRIVTFVDDAIILQSDVLALAERIQEQDQSLTPAQAKDRILKQLINDKVLLAHAKRDTNIVISEDQVFFELENRIKNLVAQLGSEAALEEAYGKSILQLKTEYQSDIRDQMLVEQFRNRKLSSVKITPEEVSTWFSQFPQDSLPQVPETVRLAHVVRRPAADPLAKKEAMDIMNVLQDSLNAGVPIEGLAQRYSDDPGSSSNGGRYQDFNLNNLVAEFGAVASTLDPGSFSGIFETEFGLHIMRLNAKVGDVVDFNHILIKISTRNTDPTEAIAFLTQIRDSIETYHLPLELAAKRHSEDALSNTRGGFVTTPQGERDLPIAALGPKWQTTIASLEIGELSQPAEVQLLDGKTAWHILLLQSKSPAHVMNLEHDYARLSQFALQNKRNEMFNSWVSKLKETVYIKTIVSIDEL